MSAPDTSSARLRVALVLLTALAGAALVLVVPPVVDPARRVPTAVPAVLALVLLGCAAASGWLRHRDRG